MNPFMRKIYQNELLQPIHASESQKVAFITRDTFRKVGSGNNIEQISGQSIAYYQKAKEHEDLYDEVHDQFDETELCTSSTLNEATAFPESFKEKFSFLNDRVDAAMHSVSSEVKSS